MVSTVAVVAVRTHCQARRVLSEQEGLEVSRTHTHLATISCRIAEGTLWIASIADMVRVVGIESIRTSVQTGEVGFKVVGFEGARRLALSAVRRTRYTQRAKGRTEFALPIVHVGPIRTQRHTL